MQTIWFGREPQDFDFIPNEMVKSGKELFEVLI